MKGRIWTGVFTGIGMLIVILDSKTALSGAKIGIELCMQSVIPSLFPFIVLSILLTNSIAGLQTKLIKPISKFCCIPDGYESLFLVGLLGGYPTGAQAVSHSYQNGGLALNDAKRMLGFCNNAGPAFIFGILSTKFDKPLIPWFLWLIHIISAIFVGAVLPRNQSTGIRESLQNRISLTDALKKTISICSTICGWVVLFRILLNFFDRWFLWLIPTEIRVLLYGVIELANGCCQLDQISDPGLRFIVCSCILSFGGICVVMQTATVTAHTGLGYYLPGKLIQLLFSFLLSVALEQFLFSNVSIPLTLVIAAAVSILILIIFLQKRENNSSIPETVGV